MSQALEGLGFGSKLRVEAWEDPVRAVHDPRAHYVERFWLPILGPSTTWFVRHLARVLDDSPKGAVIDIAETARALGLGERSGRNGPFLRTVARAVDFEVATLRGPGRLAVRRLLPMLSARQIARLPIGLRAEHTRQVSEIEGSGLDPMRQRGRRLALSLLELGEGVTETELQLGRWHFHPSIAAECAAWANAERLRATGERARGVRVPTAGIVPIATSPRRLETDPVKLVSPR